MKAWWRRFRCARRGHPLARRVVHLDGTVKDWCACGRPHLPDYYIGDDGRMWLHGQGPEPSR